MSSNEEKAKKKKEQKQIARYKKATEGLARFYKMFNQSVSSSRDNETIKITQDAITQNILKYGRNCFFVLCCHFYNGRDSYRYLSDNGQLVSTFAKARIFKDKSEALYAIKQATVTHPNKAFGIASLK